MRAYSRRASARQERQCRDARRVGVLFLAVSVPFSAFAAVCVYTLCTAPLTGPPSEAAAGVALIAVTAFAGLLTGGIAVCARPEWFDR